MSTSESLIADSSIADAVAESTIVAESSVANAESEQEKLESMFATQLDDDYNQREKSSASSFQLYLNMTIYVLNQNTLSLRDLILLIEKRNYIKTKASLSASGLDGTAYLDLKKKSFSKTSDFIFEMGNKILEFLRDAQLQRAFQNLDFIGLINSIPNLGDKESLKKSIDSLSQSDLLQDLKFPERIADEWLYLSVKRHKQGFLKNYAEIMDTIKTKAADPEVIDLTLDHFPPGVKVTFPQITKIKTLFSSYKTKVGKSPSNSVSRKRPRIDSTDVRSSKRLTDLSKTRSKTQSKLQSKTHCVVTSGISHRGKSGRKNQKGRPRKNQTVQIVADEDFDVSDDYEDQEDVVDDEDAHPEDVQQEDDESDDNDADIKNSGQDRQVAANQKEIVVDTDDTLHCVKIPSSAQKVEKRHRRIVCSDDEVQEDVVDNEDAHREDDQQEVDEPDDNIAANRKDQQVVDTDDTLHSVKIPSPAQQNEIRGITFSDEEDQEESDKEKKQDVAIAKCPFPVYSDDDKDSETSTPASNQNVVGEDHEDVNTRKRKRQSSPFSIQKNRLRKDFDVFLSSLNKYSLSSDQIIEVGRDLFLALQEKYFATPGSDVNKFAMILQTFAHQGQASEDQPVSSSVVPAATNMANSSPAPQSKQGQPSESTKSKSSSSSQSKQGQPSESSSTPQSKQAKSATASVNASKPVSSSAVSPVAKGIAQLARSAQAAKPSNDASSVVPTAPHEISTSVISREGSQSVVPPTQPESYMGSAQPLTDFLSVQEFKWAEKLREVFYNVKTAELGGFSVKATIMLQAILFFALPSQHVHPQHGNIKHFLSNIKETDLDSGNWFTVTSENAGVLAEMVLELDGKISIESATEMRNRTSNINIKSSLIPSQIEVLLSNSSELIEENANVFGLSKRILFSIAVKQPIINDIETIPMSFPVTLSGRRVVLQTFAGFYDSASSDVSTPYIRVYTRDTIVNHHGQYFLWDSDGNIEYGTGFQNRKDNDFRRPLPLLSGRAACAASRSIPLKKLFFIESMSQDEFEPQRILWNEVVLIAGTGAIKSDELEQFEQETCVDSAIINAFKDVLLSSFQPTHPRRKNNIILSVDFYAAVLKKKGDTDEEHKSNVKVYLDQYIRPLALTSDSIVHIPINYECVHYFYCAAVFSKRTIYICDSVSEKAEQLGIDHLPVYLTLCEVLNWELEYRKMPTIHWDPPNVCSDVMQQQEYPLTRCGVYCMVFLLRGFLEGIFCDSPFETYKLSKATFSNPFFKLLKKRILCVLSREISLYQLLELFVESKDLSSERRNAKAELLANNGVVLAKKSHDFVCKKGWLPDALYLLESFN